MYNAVTKGLMAILLSLSIAGCSGDHDAAEALRSQAIAAIEASDPAGALILLDSLDRAYPAEVKTRRAAMSLRPKAIELQTLRELEVNDSLTVQAQLVAESMKDLVTFRQGSGGVDGYYVAASAADAVPSSAEGLYPRMTPEGAFYIISSARKGTRSTAVALSATGEGEARTPAVAHDGERNDRSLSAELITFLPAESDTIGSYAFEHADASNPLNLTFYGEGQPRTITLPPSQLRALAELYAASKVYSRLRILNIQKNKLEQQLMLSRSQQARTMED